MDHPAVFGNPVTHSKSPRVHDAFARVAGKAMIGERILMPLAARRDR